MVEIYFNFIILNPTHLFNVLFKGTLFQINKDIQKPISESIFTINCSNKCQILNNGINCKKKAERTICKRFSDGSENYIEKTCWETSFSRYLKKKNLVFI